MKRLLFYFISSVCALYCSAQKKPLDPGSFNKWEKAYTIKLSNNGGFIAYNKCNTKCALILKSVDSSFSIEIPDAFDPLFTEDSRYLLYFKRPANNALQELYQLDLIKKAAVKVANITAFSLRVPQNAIYRSRANWIAYESPEKVLMLRDMHSGKTFTYQSSKNYFFSKSGKSFIVSSLNGADNLYTIRWITLDTEAAHIIYSGILYPEQIYLDPSERKLAFLTRNQQVSSLWYYEWGTKSPIIKATDSLNKITKFTSIGDPGFVCNGEKILLQIEDKLEPAHTHPQVTIWNTQDKYLISRDNIDVLKTQNRSRTVSVSIKDTGFVVLSKGNEKLIIPEDTESKYGLVIIEDSDPAEKDWKLEVTTPVKVYLVSLIDGSRYYITTATRDIHPFQFSPNGHFVTWYDPVQKNYFSYCIAEKIVRNITKSMEVSLAEEENDRPYLPWSYGTWKWTKDDKYVFIYDKYDVWKIDPYAKQLPQNITNSYGRLNKLTFRSIGKENTGHGTGLILSSFNHTNKFAGYYKLENAKDKYRLRKLFAGPYSFDRSIVKAKNASLYCIKMTNGIEPENIYTTTDFKTFTQQSWLNNQQKEYNWITKELLTWKGYDNLKSEGVLYRPENFDSTRKYPIIFYFYEKYASSLFRYPGNELSTGQLNIPYFVSNGYLVFVPDIRFVVGRPAESSFRSIMSALSKISEFTYVDTTRVGVQGHSYGGYQVLNLITRTNKFKAAMEGAGPVDIISEYSSIRKDGLSLQFIYETGQGRIAASLWQNTRAYIDNSPLFKLDNVETPLLMMHNRDDESVTWNQAVQCFTSLRRLKKKAWLLDYPGEHHFLSKYEHQLDFTIRMKEFFDHFLEDKPMPEWMYAEDRSDKN